MKKIKVIQIDKERFYLELHTSGIKTTPHIKDATDVSSFGWSAISYIMKGLADAGHSAKIIDYVKKK
ncbi:hypothetical protein PQE66_gp007 [Bacillus phage PBC2]|uniref:Uncharacterized protein n=1 Tax=Bacillus phage PBC2 TaxID=1675029 RepID=A0A218KBQ6_9CAUD|nr:hypothetical protein PQE66_gp007 [Bacillus phage PBC2]AKQ08322.1 hypothetical protein PBC2_007 [Bacillus phage PBC2]